MSATIVRLHHAPSTTVHRLTSVATAAIVGVVGWISIDVVGGTELVVGSGTGAETIGGPRIAASAVAAALCGWAVLVLIENRVGAGRRAMRLWRWISVGVIVASLAGPLTADAPTATRWSLVALHASVGVAYIAAMSRPATAR
jgi:hypothetical protein